MGRIREQKVFLDVNVFICDDRYGTDNDINSQHSWLSKQQILGGQLLLKRRRQAHKPITSRGTLLSPVRNGNRRFRLKHLHKSWQIRLMTIASRL